MGYLRSVWILAQKFPTHTSTSCTKLMTKPLSYQNPPIWLTFTLHWLARGQWRLSCTRCCPLDCTSFLLLPWLTTNGFKSFCLSYLTCQQLSSLFHWPWQSLLPTVWSSGASWPAPVDLEPSRSLLLSLYRPRHDDELLFVEAHRYLSSWNFQKDRCNSFFTLCNTLVSSHVWHLFTKSWTRTLLTRYHRCHISQLKFFIFGANNRLLFNHLKTKLFFQHIFNQCPTFTFEHPNFVLVLIWVTSRNDILPRSRNLTLHQQLHILSSIFSSTQIYRVPDAQHFFILRQRLFLVWSLRDIQTFPNGFHFETSLKIVVEVNYHALHPNL